GRDGGPRRRPARLSRRRQFSCARTLPPRGLAFAEVAVTLRRAMRFLAPSLAVLALLAPVASAAKSSVPPLLFPAVGSVTFRDDFGEPRGALKHQGNDLVGDKRSPVVAVEEGTVKYWTTSV